MILTFSNLAAQEAVRREVSTETLSSNSVNGGSASKRSESELEAIREKRVVLKKLGETGVLAGELDLGHIKCNVSLEVKFQIENGSSDVIRIRGLKPSCACTSVQLKQVDLAASESTAEPAHMKIKPPQTRGQLVLATIQLLDAVDAPPVGVISVRAFVERPFYLTSNYVAIGLGAESMIEVPVGVDPKLDLKEIAIVTDGVAKAELVRLRDTPILRLSGNRNDLLSAKQLTVTLKYINEIEGWDVTDSLFIDVFDGLACRVAPASPKVKDGRVSFMLYRKDSIDTSKLKLSPRNCEVDCQFVARSPKIVQVNARVASLEDDGMIEIGDGNFVVKVPLTLEKD